jgi:protein PhnA
MEVKDSNGNVLVEGDAVTVIKDLKVRGSSTVIKRGTKVKNIRLTEDESEIEGKVEGSVMVLRTEFLKKALCVFFIRLDRRISSAFCRF